MDEGLEAVVCTLAAAAVFKKPKLFKIRNTLGSFVDTDEISIPENEPFEFTGVLREGVTVFDHSECPETQSIFAIHGCCCELSAAVMSPKLTLLKEFSLTRMVKGHGELEDES